MIIGIVGFRGTGKNAVADILQQYKGFEAIGFADRLKRVCLDIFDFTEEQLWGTQTQKEAPDLRYPRKRHIYAKDDQRCQCCGVSGGVVSDCFLTPRYAMQIMGTEGARQCYPGIWAKRALDDAIFVEQTPGYHYSQRWGVQPLAGHVSTGLVFTDNRFVNEVAAILHAGGKVYRIKRMGYDAPAYDHASETEQLQIPDDRLSGVIMNFGTLDDLRNQVLEVVRP